MGQIFFSSVILILIVLFFPVGVVVVSLSVATFPQMNDVSRAIFHCLRLKYIFLSICNFFFLQRCGRSERCGGCHLSACVFVNKALEVWHGGEGLRKRERRREGGRRETAGGTCVYSH